MSARMKSADSVNENPRSLLDLFWCFSWIALQGFGGVLAIVQREIVERRRWLTKEQFLEDWAVAQILPGANIANLAILVGARSFGVRGALVALSGMIVVPMAIVLVVAILYGVLEHNRVVQGAVQGMAAVTAGLTIATALKLALTMKKNSMGIPMCIAIAGLTLGGLAVLHLRLGWILACLGTVSYIWAYRKMAGEGGHAVA